MTDPRDITERQRALEARRNGWEVLDLVRWGVSLATLYVMNSDPAVRRSVGEFNDVMTYVEQRVPQGKKVQVTFRKRPYGMAEVMIPGSYDVYPTGQAHLPASGRLSDNTRLVVLEVEGKGNPGGVKVTQDWLARIRGQQQTVIQSAQRIGPVMTTAGPDMPDATLREIDLMVETIERYHAERARRETGGGGGGAANAPWAADDTGFGTMDPPPPVIMDLPLPDTGVAIASVGAGTARAASAKGATKAVAANAAEKTDKTTGPVTSAAVTQGSLDMHRAVANALGLPPPPPAPAHPATGLKPPDFRVESERIRKYAGRPVGDVGPLCALLRAAVAVIESTAKSPLRVPKEDPHGDVAWSRMQLAGRWRPPVENASPGDLIRVADGTAAEGGYWALVVTSADGRPDELLVAVERDPAFHLWRLPPAAAVTAAWQPRPAPAFADSNPIGAWWGPAMKRLDRLLSTFVEGTATSDDLAAFLAPPRSKVGNPRELLELLMPRMGGVGPFRPLWPGSVVAGFDDDHLGVVLPSGHIVGSYPWNEYPTIVTVASVRRFQPAFVYYPGT